MVILIAMKTIFGGSYQITDLERLVQVHRNQHGMT
jgi:hypothetical protein